MHGNNILGIIGLGLLLNFITVILFALRSISNKEVSVGIHKLYNKKIREEIRLKYPHLSKDTFILFVTLVVPFMLAIVVCIELLNSNK